MKKIAYSLLAGIAVGTIVGILVAPDEGKKTQRKLLKKGRDFTDDLKDKFEDLVDSIKHQVDSTSDYISKARGKYDDYKEEASNYAGKAKDKFESYKH
jgi:gas vesicle protein